MSSTRTYRSVNSQLQIPQSRGSTPVSLSGRAWRGSAAQVWLAHFGDTRTRDPWDTRAPPTKGQAEPADMHASRTKPKEKSRAFRPICEICVEEYTLLLLPSATIPSWRAYADPLLTRTSSPECAARSSPWCSWRAATRRRRRLHHGLSRPLTAIRRTTTSGP